MTSNTNSNEFTKRPKIAMDDLDKDDDESWKRTIGTHSGTFQADEAMGCWMLRQLSSYRHSKVVRTRDVDLLQTFDIVIDVGGTYDHTKLRYDHHQRNYDERFESGRCTKLSASGLVYRHYGMQVILQFYPNLSKEHLELVYVKLYDTLLEALDAVGTSKNDIILSSFHNRI